MMRVGSLFTGIRGLDMAVESVFDAEVVWHSEVDPHASKLLAHHHPTIPNLGDITKIDWTQVPAVDILCGGFPCQDISTAGMQAGIRKGTRSGLWFRYADAIDVLRPRFVVVENVQALITRGLQTVLGSLAKIGYDAEWGVLPAARVGTVHRRDRVFLIAWPTTSNPQGFEQREPAVHGVRTELGERVAKFGWRKYTRAVIHWEHVVKRRYPLPLNGAGRLRPMFVEWMMGLPRGYVTGLDASRTQQLRMLGNMAMPMQAEAAIRGLLARAGFVGVVKKGQDEWRVGDEFVMREEGAWFCSCDEGGLCGHKRMGMKVRGG